MLPTPTVVFLLQDVPRMYGAERVTLDLLSALREQVSVCLWLIGEQRLGAEPGALAQAACAAGIPTERFIVSGRFSWPLVRELRRRLRAIPDALLHTVGYKAHLHALVAARGVAPTVTTIHGWLERTEWKERLYEALEVRALRRDDAVVCLSSFYEQRLLALGVRRDRLHRIPTGLAAASLPPPEQIVAWPEGPFTVALVGRFSEEKNHGVLLRALARVRGEGVDVRALLAGEGPERPRIERVIASSDLSDTVRLVGYQPVRELMPRIHALVLCSRIENLPLSILEAMAWARPVVATAVGGVPDLVEDGRTGRLVSDNDDAALAAVLADWAHDPGSAREMGLAGRRRVEKEFGMERCVERHLCLYNRLK